MTGTVTSYNPTTGALVVNVTRTSGSGTYSSWATYAPGPYGNYLNLQVKGGTFANFLNGISGESAWDGIVIAANQSNNYNVPTLILTPSTSGAQVNNAVSSTVLTVPPDSSGNSQPVSFAGTQQSFVTQPGLGIGVGQNISVADSANPAETMSGTVASYNPATGALTVNVTISSRFTTGTYNAWTIAAPQTVAMTSVLNDAAAFMGGSLASNQSTIWTALMNGTTNTTGVFTTVAANAVLADGLTGNATNQVLVNIRPGIVIKNSGGDITIEGDSRNPNGIDLSGSAYSGSALNTGDPQSLNGHFGQYDEPIVLSLRAAGNLNFGSCTGNCVTAAASVALPPILGSLSDGFTQNPASGPLYSSEIPGAGASGAATLFDPAAPGAYNGLSGGLGADSATYFLTAGADLTAANPLIVNPHASGTLTVAGLPGDPLGGGLSQLFTTSLGTSYATTADPLYLYNFDSNGGLLATTLANFVDYASLVRTGSGNLSIATAQDLVLQSPLSLIYTAGTGYRVGGTAAQPLPGFTQYNGMLVINGSSDPDTLPASTFSTHGGALRLTIGGNITGDMNGNTTAPGTDMHAGTDQELPYDMSALGSQLKLQNWDPSKGGVVSDVTSGGYSALMGSFSALYATDAWMQAQAGATTTYYTLAGSSGSPATPGNYQLAWYTWFPFLENTIGSFGGGNISVKAGGNISRVQFVAPTNARDAGPMLVAGAYNAATQTGLYVQGGGNVSVAAGGNIADVYTYVQNGTTLLKAGGSIGCMSSCNSSNAVLTPMDIESSTGDVSLIAGGVINISGQTLYPNVTRGLSDYQAMTVPGFSLIQNADILSDLVPPNQRDQAWATQGTVLTGILTSVPTGALTLTAIGNVTLNVPRGAIVEYQPGRPFAASQSDLAGRECRQQRRLHHLSVAYRLGQYAGAGIRCVERGVCAVGHRAERHADIGQYCRAA